MANFQGVVLQPGSGIDFTYTGPNAVTISNSGSLSSTSINGLSGALSLLSGQNIGISSSGNAITIADTLPIAVTTNSVLVGSTTSTGTSCTSVGVGALAVNTAGYNIAVGVNALENNATGSFNVAIGTYSSAVSNTAGSNNTAVGSNQCFHYNTTGNYNCAYGSGALTANITGSNNTAVGSGAMAAGTTPSGCVSVGYKAGGGNGVNNVALGYEAMTQLGSNCICIGPTTGFQWTNGTEAYNITIGNAPGTAGDVGVTHIGYGSNSKSVILDGVYNNTPSGTIALVTMNSSGQLGTLPYSVQQVTDSSWANMTTGFTAALEWTVFGNLTIVGITCTAAGVADGTHNVFVTNNYTLPFRLSASGLPCTITDVTAGITYPCNTAIGSLGTLSITPYMPGSATAPTFASGHNLTFSPIVIEYYT